MTINKPWKLFMVLLLMACIIGGAENGLLPHSPPNTTANSEELGDGEHPDEISTMIGPKKAADSFRIENISKVYDIFNDTLNPLDENGIHKIEVGENNNLYAVWVTNVLLKTSILYRVFFYHTQQWSTVLNLSNYNNPMYYSDFEPDLTVKGDLTYITWTRDQGIGLANRYKVFFAVIQGTDYIQTPVILTNPGAGVGSERFPSVQTNSRGDLAIVTRYKQDENNDPSKIDVNYHPITKGWDPYLENNWYRYEITNNTLYGNNLIDQTRCFWDVNNQLHVVFRARSNTIFSVYYGKNFTTFGEYSYQEFANVTNQVSPFEVPNNLILKGNNHNSMLYVGWDESKPSLAIRQIRVFNKTFSAGNFESEPCFSVFEGDAIRPSIAIDKDNHPIIAWMEKLTTQKVLYIRNLSMDEYDNITLGTNIRTPYVAIGANNDIILSHQSITNKLHYIQIDRTTPELQIITPTNNQAYSDELKFDIRVQPDTVHIKYEYWNDTNGDGTTGGDSGEIWHLITEIIAPLPVTANWGNYSWDFEGGTLDRKSIIIRINATDRNNLDSYASVSHISVDNHEPYIVDIISIADNYGNIGAVDNFCKGNITIEYEVRDATSGIEYVALFNGTDPNPLTDNRTGYSADPTKMIWITTSLFDGNYTDLFIRAYDRANKNNRSLALGYHVFVDNTPPVVSISGIVEGGKYTSTFWIYFTSDTPVKSIICQFTGGTFTNQFVNLASAGNVSHVAGLTYRIEWNTREYDDGIKKNRLDGSFFLNFTATDVWDNNISYYRTVLIDNTAPYPVFLNPLDDEYIGVILDLYVTTNNDTAQLIFGYMKTFTTDFASLTYKQNITENLFQTGSNLSAFLEIDLSGNEAGLYTLGLNSTDDMGLWRTQLIYITLVDAIPLPNKVTQITFVYNATNGGYNVNVTFHTSSSSNLAIYFVYRSLTDFDYTAINKLSPLERLHVMEPYFIGAMVDPDPDDDYPYIIFEDEGLPSNIYYYSVIVINTYGNPSKLFEGAKVVLPKALPAKEINLTDLQLMPYVFLGVVALMAVAATTIVKSAQKVRHVRKVKKVYEDILSQDYAPEDKVTGEDSLTKRLDAMEDLLDEQISGDSGVKKQAKRTKIDVDELLTMEVEEKKEESILSSGLIKKCRNCGWALSATATKCPRCGLDYY